MSLMNLFNGGGSVGGGRRPNMRDVAGPSRLERLLSNPQFNEGNRGSSNLDPDFLRQLQQGPGVIDRTIQNQTPGGGIINRNPSLPPWHQENLGGGQGSFWNVNARPGNNTGVMAAMAGNPMVQQAKDFYSIFDPWIPNMDIAGDTFGYEFEKPILGGTLGFGFDYDWDDENVGAFMNWKKQLGG